MRKPILSIFGGMLVLAAAGQVVMLMDGTSRLTANAKPSEVMAGCTDVPEAVALACTASVMCKGAATTSETLR